MRVIEGMAAPETVSTGMFFLTQPLLILFNNGSDTCDNMLIQYALSSRPEATCERPVIQNISKVKIRVLYFMVLFYGFMNLSIGNSSH